MTGVLRAVLVLMVGAAWMLAGFVFLTTFSSGATGMISMAVFAGVTVVSFFMLLYCFHTEKLELYLKKTAEKDKD